jgi:hypothetical protein
LLAPTGKLALKKNTEANIVKYRARLRERMADDLPAAKPGDERRVFWLMYFMLEYVQRCTAMMAAGFFTDTTVREEEFFSLIRETVTLLDQELNISNVDHDEELWRDFVSRISALEAGGEGASIRAAETSLLGFMDSVSGYVPPY